MDKSVSIALLVLGVGLLIFGVSSAGSFSSDVSRVFTGNPTDKAMWLLIAGAFAGVAGLFGLLRGSRR
jgi:hypothetical protein